MHMPLDKAATGHLCVELDHYDKVPANTGGVPEKVPTLFADGSSPVTLFDNNAAPTASRTGVTTREIGTQTDAKVMFSDSHSTTLAATSSDARAQTRNFLKFSGLHPPEQLQTRIFHEFSGLNPAEQGRDSRPPDNNS